MSEKLEPLARLKSLGDLAEQKVMPTVVIDTREQAPLVFRNLVSIRGTLYTADYSFLGGESLFAYERKSVADLVMSVTTERDRFFHELSRMGGYRWKRLMVVGDGGDPVEAITAGRYRSKTRPASVLASIATIQARFAIPVQFFTTPEEAALTLERDAYYAARELVRGAEEILRAHNKHASEICIETNNTKPEIA